MPRYVPPAGKLDAKIVAIGECPGKYENQRGIPFCGPSGARMEQWWHDAGFQRSDVYITNVHKYQPRANKIETVPKAELAASVEDLVNELSTLTDPYVIVPTGNVALRALTGNTKITNWRGSILTTALRNGRTVKVIPTIHAAATFRTPYYEKCIRRDWQRIAEEAKTREAHLPERERAINPTLGDLEAFCAEASKADALAIDIETPRKITTELVGSTKKGKPKFKKNVGARRITLVGFAYAPDFSFTIPVTEAYWGSADVLDYVWKRIRELCALPCEKILQNGLFDSFWLARHDVHLTNYRYDTMAMHHCFDSGDKHSLAYMASLDTREPYWKSQGKDEDEDEDDPSEAGFDDYQRYNGTDCCVEYELGNLYSARLARQGLTKFYHQHYSELFQPLLQLMQHGVGINERQRRKRLATLNAECISIQDELTTLAGEPLYTKKSLSTKRVSTFLYDKLKIKRQFVTAMVDGERTRKSTVNEVALRKIGQTVKDETARRAIELILRHRRAYQVSTFLQEGKADDDNRMRCQYRFTTEFMRLSSRQNPLGTGRNLQNIDRDVLDIFEPDDEHIFMEVDCSQIEDRQTKVYSYNINGDATVLERARSMPWENDEHRRAAAIIFCIAPSAVTPAQRYLGKRGRHATNYGMAGKTLSEQLMKEGYVYTPDECQAFINSLKSKDTYIEDYQKDVRLQLIRTHMLTNSWGKMFDFTYERLDDALFRRGYACRPQSDTGMLLNQWGLKPCTQFIHDNRLDAAINMQVHDSLKISVLPQDVVLLARMLKASLERPRLYGPTKLAVPVEFKLGTTAACEHEFKQLQTAAQWSEFEEVAYALWEKRRAA